MKQGLRSRQKGMGWFGLLFIFAVLGFFTVVGMKVLPLYLNQMKITSSVNKVAGDPSNANAEVGELRKSLQRYWDIESIDALTPRDIKVKRTEEGRFLSYDYEAREHLFYNIYVVIHFQADVPLRAQAS
jgi:hypothetical protein